MLSKKYIIALYTIVLCIHVQAEDTVKNEQNRVVPITRCKKIDFGLTINQENASLEEREAALQLITDFCNESLDSLSNSLKEKAPHVSITLVLLNIEEDQDTNNTNQETISIDTENTYDVQNYENIEQEEIVCQYNN